MQLTLSEERSPAAAARAFAARDGVRAGVPADTRINGLAAVTLTFATTAEDGQVIQGDAAFIAYGDRVYRILGYAPRERWSAYGAEVGRAAGSFRELDEPAALAAMPWRIEVVRLERALTIDAFARRYPGPVPADRLALINGVVPGARLEAGGLAKRIIGEAPSS